MLSNASRQAVNCTGGGCLNRQKYDPYEGLPGRFPVQAESNLW